ncbi:MAG TPA: hypothetical protein VM802_10515 [Chitinophaga sp.]|uniref:hypothetical protein n=1 Tax=Chitinophaga sp. TaxID=1869181 RepID=UPI002CDA3553|nr:hypothetical protein [Chitinophaga sp.]HVI45296.1 hypothetical protein [Chitinophaga sp.]
MYNVSRNCKCIPLLFSVLILCACGTSHRRLHGNLRLLDKHMLVEGSYVVIPNEGCEGCISTAESFVKKNIHAAANIRYIFTRIQSSKLLKIKLGNDVMSSNRVLLDTANIIEYPDKANNIYPMVIILHDGKIARVTYQSPASNGLSGLLNGEE